MNKKVLVISTTLRKEGNSDILADYFLKGAEESQNIVEKVSLVNKKIEFCKGCLSCKI
jgi:multimeric flavodoxin WrbA